MKKKAFQFLKKYQLLPDDQLSVEECEEYESIIDYFIENPDPECIPLFSLTSTCNSSIAQSIIINVLQAHDDDI